MPSKSRQRGPFQIGLSSIFAAATVVALLVATPRLSEHLPLFLQVSVAAMVLASSCAGVMALASVVALASFVRDPEDSKLQRAERIRKCIEIAVIGLMAQLPLLSFVFSQPS